MLLYVLRYRDIVVFRPSYDDDDVQVTPLTDAITAATQLEPKTAEAMLLLLTAKILRKLRLCLQVGVGGGEGVRP